MEEKNKVFFFFNTAPSHKQEGYQEEQSPLAWPKDAVPGTAASATLIPQEQRPHYGLEKSPVPLHCLPEIPSVSHLFCEGKNPHNCWRIFVSLTLNKEIILIHSPTFQKPTVPL